jgi:hypothetical protein
VISPLRPCNPPRAPVFVPFWKPPKSSDKTMMTPIRIRIQNRQPVRLDLGPRSRLVLVPIQPKKFLRMYPCLPSYSETFHL